MPERAASMSSASCPSTSPMNRSVRWRFSGDTQRAPGRPLHRPQSLLRSGSGNGTATKRRMTGQETWSFGRRRAPQRTFGAGPLGRSGAGIGVALVNLLDGPEDVLAQLDSDSVDVGLQLRHAGGPDDRGAEEALAQHEGKSEVNRIEAVVPGDLHISCRRRVGLRALVALVAWPEGAPGTGRPLAIEILAAQRAGGQRRVGQESDLLADRHLGEARLVAAVQQIVGVLHRDDAWPQAPLGAGEKAHDAPGILIGEADEAHLAGLHHGIERLERLLDRRLG